MGSCYASRVLEIARGEIGYKESGTNWTKYAKDLDAVHYFNYGKQNVEWCSTFINWCIWKACTSDSAMGRKWDALYFTYEPAKDNCACGVKFWKQYFKSHGALHSSAKPGDVAFIGSGHVGLVEKVSGSKITTIEGNHGDKVARVSRSLSECSGFGRPRYDSEPKPQPTPTPTPVPEKKAYSGTWPKRPARGYFQRYDAGEEVKNLQKLLLWTVPGCLPKFGVDGEIGTETLNAVRACQKLWGVKVDGFYGKDSEAAAKNFKK